MSLHPSIVPVAVCVLLTACDRPKAGARQWKPAKDDGLVFIRLPGVSAAVPHKEREEWWIRKATILHLAPTLKDGPWYLGVQALPPPDPLVRHPSRAPVDPSVPPPPPLPPAEPPVPPEVWVSEDAIAGLRRISGIDLRHRSACVVTADSVVDKASGREPGHLFSINGIFWLSSTEAEVPVEWWSSSTKVTRRKFLVRKIDGTWRIMGTTPGRFPMDEPIGCG